MIKLNYEEQAKKLAIAIDIAINSIQMYPPKDWDENHIRHVVKVYATWKNELFHTENRFKNIKSLNYVINDVFTFFQESSGKAVDHFWIQIKEVELPYKRENKLAKIIERKKIKTSIEYDFVTDVLVAYQQDGLISPFEVILLNELLSEYEEKGRN